MLQVLPLLKAALAHRPQRANHAHQYDSFALDTAFQTNFSFIMCEFWGSSFIFLQFGLFKWQKPILSCISSLITSLLWACDVSSLRCATYRQQCRSMSVRCSSIRERPRLILRAMIVH